MIAAVGAGVVSQLQQGLSSQKPSAASSAPPAPPHRSGQAHAPKPPPTDSDGDNDGSAVSASAAKALTAAKSLLLGAQAGGATSPATQGRGAYSAAATSARG